LTGGRPISTLVHVTVVGIQLLGAVGLKVLFLLAVSWRLLSVLCLVCLSKDKLKVWHLASLRANEPLIKRR
jgi:hypothetical protein